MELSPGAQQYLVTALWSTNGYNETMLADKYSVSDIPEEFLKQAQIDFDKFYAMAQNLFTEDELDFEQIGHNFWLTREGHGAGFWDGDYKNGEMITKIIKANFEPISDTLRDMVDTDDNEYNVGE